MGLAQTVINSPKTGLSIGNYSIVNKIVLTDTTTSLYIKTNYNPGMGIRIQKETYIQPNGGEKIFIKRTEGILFNKQYTIIHASAKIDGE